jgi:hypothetical protein
VPDICVADTSRLVSCLKLLKFGGSVPLKTSPVPMVKPVSRVRRPKLAGSVPENFAEMVNCSNAVSSPMLSGIGPLTGVN